MQLPKLTNQQKTILKLLYRYRFLNRKQIQAFMRHKDKRRVSAWLKDLREKQYTEWIYDAHDFAEKTKPAIYYLDINGIRYLRDLNLYPAEELRKRYKESLRRQDFISRCVLIADCCVNLEAKKIDDVVYSYATEADYIDPENDYHFLTELKPQLCFIKEATAKGGVTVTNYLLEIFDTSTPRYSVRKKLKDYAAYLEGPDWLEDFEDKPIVLIACPTKANLIYAKRRTRKLLEDFVKSEDTHMRFATTEEVKLSGVTAKIWEEV